MEPKTPPVQEEAEEAESKNMPGAVRGRKKKREKEVAASVDLGGWEKTPQKWAERLKHY